MKWNTEQRKISELVEFNGNPRQMTEKQVQDLTASLEKFDLAEIPAVTTHNKILAGHQRLKIMAMLGRGDEVIDVRVPDRELTEEEEREYLIRSNKNTGEWDIDTLANGFDLDNLTNWGFEDDDLMGKDSMAVAEGEDMEQVIQLPPTREYIVVMCDADSWQFDKLIDLLKLKNKRRGGYKRGSSFDQVAMERVIPASRIIALLDEESQT